MSRGDCPDTIYLQAFRHLDLMPTGSFQVVGSMPVDTRLALRFSLKRSSGWQLGLMPDAAGRPLESKSCSFIVVCRHSTIDCSYNSATH